MSKKNIIDEFVDKFIVIGNGKLVFKTYDEFDKYCEGKDIQFCSITVKEGLSDEEYCKRYSALSINTRTRKIINYLP